MLAPSDFGFFWLVLLFSVFFLFVFLFILVEAVEEGEVYFLLVHPVDILGLLENSAHVSFKELKVGEIVLDWFLPTFSEFVDEVHDEVVVVAVFTKLEVHFGGGEIVVLALI